MEEWVKKLWFVCTMEYNSAIKKKEILPWMSLADIMLCEMS